MILALVSDPNLQLKYRIYFKVYLAIATARFARMSWESQHRELDYWLLSIANHFAVVCEHSMRLERLPGSFAWSLSRYD